MKVSVRETCRPVQTKGDITVLDVTALPHYLLLYHRVKLLSTFMLLYYHVKVHNVCVTTLTHCTCTQKACHVWRQQSEYFSPPQKKPIAWNWWRMPTYRNQSLSIHAVAQHLYIMRNRKCCQRRTIHWPQTNSSTAGDQWLLCQHQALRSLKHAYYGPTFPDLKWPEQMQVLQMSR